MTTSRSNDYLTGLVRELCKLPRETGWVEFKENSGEPKLIGEYLSALANSAALEGPVSSIRSPASLLRVRRPSSTESADARTDCGTAAARAL